MREHQVQLILRLLLHCSRTPEHHRRIQYDEGEYHGTKIPTRNGNLSYSAKIFNTYTKGTMKRRPPSLVEGHTSYLCSNLSTARVYMQYGDSTNPAPFTPPYPLLLIPVLRSTPRVLSSRRLELQSNQVQLNPSARRRFISFTRLLTLSITRRTVYSICRRERFKQRYTGHHSSHIYDLLSFTTPQMNCQISLERSIAMKTYLLPPDDNG